MGNDTFGRATHRFRALLVALTLGAITTLGATAQDNDNRLWPREFKGEDASTLVVHQPQVQSWKGHKKLDFRAAIEVKVGQSPKPTFGAVRAEMDTVVHHGDRSVMLTNLKLLEVTFPELSPSLAKATERVMRTLLPTKGMKIALDRILTNLEREPGTKRSVALKNDPPKIILSYTDAVLIDIDGEPMFEKVGKSGLEVVINTKSDLFRAGSAFFLRVGDSWLTAPALGGPWTAASSLPNGLSALPSTARFAGVRKHVPGKPLDEADVPKVYVANKPTELIAFLGEPVLKEIPGTQLSYAVNTENDCFRCAGDDNYYVLLSGRWFRTKGKESPLVYCSKDLPPDFAKIPERHPAGRVLASVPGTEHAEEALLAASVPRRARVARTTKVAVSYEGAPEFKAIEGAKGVEAAVNTSYHVYRVAGKYYCCDRGVWFTAADPMGPWTVCDKVPDAIYTIPPDSPYYPDTFVFVYDSDDDYVDTGYWPGYYGCYGYDGYACYGTGYWYRYWGRRYYRHWYRHWRPRPMPYHTYGASRYYDHVSGRFRRAESARRHQAAGEPYRGAYESWGGAVKPTAMTRAITADRARGTVRRGGNDLYAGRDGSVFRRTSAGEWELYKKSGWQARARAEERERAAERTKVRREAAVAKKEEREAERAKTREAKKARDAERRHQKQLERAYKARDDKSRLSTYRNYGVSRGYYRHYSRGGRFGRGGGRR